MKYDPEAWERKGSSFDNNYNRKNLLSFRKFVVDILLGYDSKVDSMLDVACCTGWYIQQLRERNFQSKYVGVDITPNLVQRAKEDNPVETFLSGDIRDLSFEDNSFELVFAGGIIMHLDPEEASKAMSELFRVSSKNVFVYTYGHCDKPTSRNFNEQDKFINVYYSLSDLMNMIPEGWKLESKTFKFSRWFLTFIKKGNRNE